MPPILFYTKINFMAMLSFDEYKETHDGDYGDYKNHIRTEIKSRLSDVTPDKSNSRSEVITFMEIIGEIHNTAYHLTSPKTKV